jgi:cyclic-di-GMP phosphodiesterase TipF (flagellum assembly factor)
VPRAPEPLADAAAPAASEAAPEESKPTLTAGRFRGMDRDSIIAMLRNAVEANRVDLYLQPIVTLPQRKVRYYEALSRLRGEDGQMMLGADFLKFAEMGALMPKIDNLLLFRCVQVVRRLLMKNRDIGLFCNISSSTLSSPDFPRMLEFVEANRVLAPALIFEFTQQAYRAMGPLEFESLAALRDRGFRFSLDHVGDLRIEPRELAERGVRFVKVPASLLLTPTAAATSDIHPADLSDLLGRYGIDLIVERIESETSVVDLLDFDVRYGQGFLFSQPRPVRNEALGAADAVPAEPEEAPRPVARAANPSMPGSSANPLPFDLGRGVPTPA